MVPWLRTLAAPGRGSRFNAQHPCGSSQLSVTPNPGNLMSSFSLYVHQAIVAFLEEIHMSSVC